MSAERPLRIAQVSPMWANVPPSGYGGAELIVALLADELVRLGHDVTLFAPGASKTAARLHAVTDRSVIDLMEAGKAYEYEPYANAALSEALQRAGEFDVIHAHLGAARIPVGAAATVPIVHTLHIPLSPDDQWVLRRFSRAPVVAISAYQAQAFPAERPAPTVIPHGIDFGRYPLGHGAGGYLAYLARMGPQKSPLDAIAVARAAGMPLVMAGEPQNPEERSYFRERVAPLIDGAAVRHVGTVDHAGKVDLLAGAAGLLFPIRGPEAFGLAMVEAMACGAPVLALRTASTPEIVEEGVTGFTAETPELLATRLPAALGLDRAGVRRRAYERFSHERMARDYLDLFRRLAGAV